MIERNYWESDFDVDMLAHQLHISRRQLYRLFEESGERPAAVIADRRVSEAERLIETTKKSAMANVRGIAADAASEIVKRLTGEAPAKQSLERAVDAALH